MAKREKGQTLAPPGKKDRGPHNHLEWVDNHDGTNREEVTLSDHPQRTPPPRPVPGPVPERCAAPAQFGVYEGRFGRIEAKRLLDRAGFGPRPGEADALALKGLREAVHSLTRPQGEAVLNGPEPYVEDGELAPLETSGHDHLWWLDRMVRSDQPLVERMTLVLHDWFPTSNDEVRRPDLILSQHELLRRFSLGSFADLLVEVTTDPAMLIYLSGIKNRKQGPNENYARELQELFCLGADRGAYTEDDVREMTRALTGWRADVVGPRGFQNFRFNPTSHDYGLKTIYGQTGAFDWRDVCRLVVEHPMHPDFFATKLWGYFVPTPPTADTLSELCKLYVESGHQIRPVLEAILMHPDFYLGPRMVKPPVVHLASLLRASGRGIETESLSWRVWIRPARCSSIRPMSLAGRTPGGSTHRRCAAAGSMSLISKTGMRSRSGPSAGALTPIPMMRNPRRR